MKKKFVKLVLGTGIYFIVQAVCHLVIAFLQQREMEQAENHVPFSSSFQMKEMVNQLNAQNYLYLM